MLSLIETVQMMLEAMTRMLVHNFSHENITEPKRLLAQEIDSVAGVKQYWTDRRNSSVRTTHEAELDDIIGIMDTADAGRKWCGYLFVAANL